jgi:hypothetical protein
LEQAAPPGLQNPALAVSLQIVGSELARDSEVGIARERASYIINLAASRSRASLGLFEEFRLSDTGTGIEPVVIRR